MTDEIIDEHEKDFKEIDEFFANYESKYYTNKGGKTINTHIFDKRVYFHPKFHKYVSVLSLGYGEKSNDEKKSNMIKKQMIL